MSFEKPPVLTVGLESGISKIIDDILKNTQISTIPMEVDHLLAEVSPPPCMVISGPPTEALSGTELAQTLRMQYPNSPIFICCTAREGFERNAFVGNGFTDAFLLPMDTSSLRTSISESLSRATQGQIRVYRPVKIIDIEAGNTLDFDTSLFLPANNKYVKLSLAGDSLDQSKIDKIKKSKFNNIQIPLEQMKKFYEYTAKRLKELNTGTFSATERKEKLSTAVRDLISGLFTEQTATFEAGQAIMKDCGEIVKTYIMQGADNEWYIRIQQLLGEKGDSYSHSANISTLAALFSIGLGIGKPENLALAGLLHDIGIAELPAEIQKLDEGEMNKEQREIYQKHPQMAVNLIKSKKMVIPEIVMKTILQHHELYNGTGFPSGLFGDRICKEAQIIALADQFDYLTRLRPGKPLLTPIDAVAQMRSEQINNPSRIHYHPELLKQLLSLFPQAEKTAAA